MALRWMLICLLMNLKLSTALQLTSSPEQPVLGSDFHLFCSIEQKAVTFAVEKRTVCDILGVFSNGTCKKAQSCNGTFGYSCNSPIYTLTIPSTFNIEVFHGSTWTCQNFYGGSPSKPKKLYVKVPITTVSIKPRTVGIAVDADQTFNCTTDAGRPNARIQWYISDGTNLTALATQQPGCGPTCPETVVSTSLVVYTGKRIDQGKAVYCIASNIDGGRVQSQNAIIAIFYGPNFVVLSPSTPSYTVTEGSGSIRPITCTADCNPNCTMTWSGPNLIGGTTSILNLHDISRNQAGAFICTASNSIGNKTADPVLVTVNYGPSSVFLSPSTPSYTVAETSGKVGPISCTADCRPSCTITWSGPNLPSGTTSKLNLRNITRNQAGDYQCTARNSLGNDTSVAVTVTVNYGPNSVVLSPPTPSYTVTEGSGSIGPITCSADCKPNCTMTWDGPNLPDGTTSLLNLQNISRNQAGHYRCSAVNEIGNRTSATVTYIVNYGPNVVSFIPPNTSYTVTETTGSVGPITCTADCRPNCTMTWNGPNLPDGTTSIINIQNINRNQAGNFQCTANNSFGRNISVAVSIIVNYGPSSAMLSPSILSYTETETTGGIGPITCTAHCRPNCTMTWSGPNLPGDTTSVLKLQNINRTQAGDYQCTASNSVGSNRSAIVTVIVNYLPTIISIDGNTSYTENEPSTFHCQVDSIPKSTIIWKFKDGNTTRNLPVENDLIHTVNNSFLEVVQMHCLSMGLYICEASNGIGLVEMDLNVTVYCAPRLNTIENIIQSNITVGDNEALTIRVPILAYPEPRIHWQFIQNSSVSNITSGIKSTSRINRQFSTLYIQNMTKDKFGLYAIYAENGIMDSTDYIGIYEVTAARRPDKPSNVTCFTGSDNAIVSWQPEFDGGSPQTFKVFYKTLHDNSFEGHVENISETDYHPIEISNLLSSNIYLMQVHAFNIYNTAVSDEIYCNTTAKGETNAESLIALGVGAGVGSAVTVIFVVLTVIFVFRRLQSKANKNDQEPIKRSNEEEETDTLEDNPLYVSSADDFVNQGDVYGQVSKEKKQGTCSTSPIKKKNKGKSNKPIELGCVYENHDNFLEKDVQIYANQSDNEDSTKNYNPTKNKDGLIYADLELAPVSEGRRFVIHGEDNRNSYAIIDLSKKADPLPSDEEEEVEGGKENK